MQHAPITTPITDKLASMPWIRWFRQLVDRVEEVKKTSDAHTHPQYLTEETDPTVPAHVKEITQTDIDLWNTPSTPSLSLNDLTDVDTASNAEGDLLRRGADGIWYPAHVTISEDAPTGTPGTLDWIWFVVDPL